MLSILKNLLPRAKAWDITVEKPLRWLFVGISSLIAQQRTYIDTIWDDLLPSRTRQLEIYESQLDLPASGLPEAERRDRLAAALKAKGGQSPRAIQDNLQAAGFDVYVHEWWNPEELDWRGDWQVFDQPDPLWPKQIAFSGERFVAASRSGTVISSQDAINWEVVFLPVSDSWEDVAWAGGAFILVGTESLLTSVSGTLWSAQTVPLPVGKYLRAVGGTDGLWITGGTGGFLATSPDKTTWTSRSIGNTETVTSIGYSDELGLAVIGQADGTIQVSPDGTSWTPVYNNFAVTGGIKAFTWSPELKLFVAVSAFGKAMTSRDGKSWHLTTLDYGLSSVAWSSEMRLFVATAELQPSPNLPLPDTTIFYSLDGFVWRPSQLWSSIGWSSVTAGNSAFVATGVDFSSGDARTGILDGPLGWSETSLTGAWEDAAWSPELKLFVAVGSDGKIGYSRGGVYWETIDTVGTYRGVDWSPSAGVFVAAGSRPAWSADGINWTQAAGIFTVNTDVVHWSESAGLFFLFDRLAASTEYHTSPDGINWTQRVSTQFASRPIVACASNGSTVLALSSDGYAIPSSDGGLTWGTQSFTMLNPIRSIAWSEGLGLWIVGGADGYATSSSGAGWTTVSDLPVSVVGWLPEVGKLYALASNAVYYSRDGSDWSSEVMSSESTWLGAAWSPARDALVAVSSDSKLSFKRAIATDWVFSEAGLVPRGTGWSPELGIYALGTSGQGIKTSADGLTWATALADSDYEFGPPAWSPSLGIFVIRGIHTGAENARSYTSPDGVTWTPHDLPTDYLYTRTCIWIEELGLFVAGGTSGSVSIATSPDGIIWTDAYSEEGCYSLAWSPELGLIVAGLSNGIVTSPDGVTWTPFIDDLGVTITSATWSPERGRFVVIGGLTATSSDGVNWDLQVGAGHQVIWMDKVRRFARTRSALLPGTPPRLELSEDGIIWEEAPPEFAGSWGHFTWSSDRGQLLAVTGNTAEVASWYPATYVALQNGGVIPKDPRAYLDGEPGYVLADSSIVRVVKELTGAGDSSSFAGETLMEAGNYSLLTIGSSALPPSDPSLWPYFLYIGGETFPSGATVPAARKEEFEKLCRKICPGHLWLGILVEFN